MNNIVLEIKEINKYITHFLYNHNFINVSNKIIKLQKKQININYALRLPQIQKRKMGLLFN